MRANRRTSVFGVLGVLAVGMAMATLGCGGDDASSPKEDGRSSGSGGSGGDGAGNGSGGVKQIDPPDGFDTVPGFGEEPDLSHTITVVDALDAPQAGIDIVSHDAEGEVYDHMMTSSSGMTTLEIPEGGSVMAFWSLDSDRFIQAYYDVPGGSAVRFRIPGIQPAPGPVPKATTFKHYLWGAPSDAAKVGVEGGCDSDWLQGFETSVEISNQGCTGDATQDLLFSARDAAGNFLAWQLLADQPTNPGGVVSFEVGIQQKSVHDVSLGLEGVPPGAKMVQREAQVRIGKTLSSVDESGAPNSLPAKSVLALPSIDGARYINRLGANMGGGQTGSAFSYVIEDADPIDSTFVDAADYGWIAAELPDVADPMHPTARWNIAAPPPVDACQVRMGWGSSASTVHFMAMLAPDHQPVVRMPELPASLAGFRPGADTTTNMVEVECTEWGNIDGYADVVSAAVPGTVDGAPQVTLTAVAYLNAP